MELHKQNETRGTLKRKSRVKSRKARRRKDNIDDGKTSRK